MREQAFYDAEAIDRLWAATGKSHSLLWRKASLAAASPLLLRASAKNASARFYKLAKLADTE
jgi:hypothetical protein